MTTISRRTILAAMAALPASAGPGRAFTAPEAQETALPPPLHPMERLHGLHDELSELVGVHDRMFGGKWELRVRAPAADYPSIVYMNVGSLTPQDRIALAVKEYKAAAMALDPTASDWMDLREDDSACAFMLAGFRVGARR